MKYYFKLGLLFTITLGLLDCGAATIRKFTIEGATEVRICTIGSDNQQPVGSTDVNGNYNPITNQVTASLSGKGLFAGYDITIKMATGTVDIKEAGNRNQGIPIPDIMEKLFKSGYPFPFEKIKKE